LKNTPSVINNNNDLINLTIFQISSKIEHFEQVIDDIVSLHRHKYISQRFTHIKKFFLNKSQKKENGKTIENGYLELDDLALVIEETLAQVTQEFNNEAGFIRFFGVKDFSNPSKLSLIASSEGRTFNQEFGDYYFDLGLIPSSIIESKITISNFENFDSSCSISREDLDQLKNGLIIEKGLTDFQKNDIIRYYPTLASNITFVFWKRYVNFQSSDIPSSPQFLIFKNAMLDLYTYIASSYATLWASQSEKKLEDAVRISGHESNQIIPTLRDNLIKTFRKDETIKLLDNIRTGALYKRIDDFLINLDLVKFIYERPAYVFMTFNLNSNEFNEVDVISIFKKLRNLYFSKSRRKSKKIDIIDEQGKFIIKADKMLIEHVLNNLVDNAVKYSYRGTKIRLQTRKEKNYNMIHIISYGPRITSGEKIYNLYYREQLNSEGLGIGMYISRKIIKAHNGEINHNSTLLSSYNLACLTSFEQFREKYKLCPSEMSQIDSIIKNAKLLNETTDLDEILSTAPNNKVLYQPDEFTFTLEYKLPTYKNDFFIKIPNLFNS
jgi:signal transduction histidine kinase